MADVTELTAPIRNGSTITIETLTLRDGVVQAVLPSNVSPSNKLATLADIPSVSGGHTIENASGTAMTERTNLKFRGLTVTDDSANDATVVSLSISGTATAGAFLTSDGVGGYQWTTVPQAEGSDF